MKVPITKRNGKLHCTSKWDNSVICDFCIGVVVHVLGMTTFLPHQLIWLPDYFCASLFELHKLVTLLYCSSLNAIGNKNQI